MSWYPGSYYVIILCTPRMKDFVLLQHCDSDSFNKIFSCWVCFQLRLYSCNINEEHWSIITFNLDIIPLIIFRKTIIVLDQSAQSSTLGGRTSAPAIDRSAQLLGQLGGSCDWVSDVCISPFCMFSVTLRA